MVVVVVVLVVIPIAAVIAEKITSQYPCFLRGHCNHHGTVYSSLIIASSLGDLPCLMSTGDERNSYSSRRRGADAGQSCYSLVTASKKNISPRKRSRTARLQHIQRPCLDFEKMQQVGTTVRVAILLFHLNRTMMVLMEIIPSQMEV